MGAGCECTMKFVAGWDGGGTKTAVVIANIEGQQVSSLQAGPLNYNGQNEESIGRHVREICETIARVCGGLNRCVQICIGTAGVSNAAAVARLEAAVRDCGYTGGLYVVGDHETALYGAHGRPHGMILIAGTGSICYGKDASGREHRTGGFGYLIDDEGSGYSIGRDLLAATVRAHDGRLERTVIAQMVYRQLGLSNVQQLIAFVYDSSTNKKDIAALAPILLEACDMSDPAALDIAKRNAKALAELVVPVAERLAMQEGALAMAGSVLLRNAYVQKFFRSTLLTRYPHIDCIAPKQDAASGAAAMALQRLIETTSN